VQNGPSEGRLTLFLSDHLPPKEMLREGSVRADDADDLLMDYTYTGQRSEAALGLMYYVARW
jgi:hypothetical protein